MDVPANLLSRYGEAVALHRRWQQAHVAFTATLLAENVRIWENLCEQWVNAPIPKDGVFNPFDFPEKRMRIFLSGFQKR